MVFQQGVTLISCLGENLIQYRSVWKGTSLAGGPVDVINSILSADTEFGCHHYTLILGQDNTNYSQKHSGKFHLFPKFPLLRVTLDSPEIPSVNQCDYIYAITYPCLGDSSLFEVEWVAHSLTFPTPAWTALLFCALFTSSTGRGWGDVGRCCDCSVPAALDLAVVSEWFVWLAWWGNHGHHLPCWLSCVSIPSQVMDTLPQGRMQGRLFACSTQSWGSHWHSSCSRAWASAWTPSSSTSWNASKSAVAWGAPRSPWKTWSLWVSSPAWGHSALEQQPFPSTRNGAFSTLTITAL